MLIVGISSRIASISSALASIAVAFMLPSACSPFTGREVELWVNAAWALDSNSAILLSYVYVEGSPGAPYWSMESGHSNFRTRAYLADSALADPRLIAEWGNDEGESEGGRMRSTPLFWAGTADSLGYLCYMRGDAPILRRLDTGAATVLRMPTEHEAELVWDVTGIAPSPGERVPAFYALPSPDGAWVGVAYRLAFLPGENPLDMRFAHAFALFDSRGNYVAGAAPSFDDFQFSQMRMGAPSYIPPLPAVEPPAVSPIDAVYASIDPSLLWAPDSSGFYVAGRSAASGEPVAAFFAQASSASLVLIASDHLPARAEVLPGGAIDSRGRLLALDSLAGEAPPRVAAIAIPGWEGGGEVPAAEAYWVY